MTALEVHTMKRYEVSDLPQVYAEIISKKKCVNCKQHLDLQKKWNIEFAKTKITIVWWHQPKVVKRIGYITKQQCPQ